MSPQEDTILNVDTFTECVRTKSPEETYDFYSVGGPIDQYLTSNSSEGSYSRYTGIADLSLRNGSRLENAIAQCFTFGGLLLNKIQSGC